MTERTYTQDDIDSIAFLHNQAIEDLKNQVKAYADILRLEYDSTIKRVTAKFEEMTLDIRTHVENVDAIASERNVGFHKDTLAHNDKTQKLLALAALQAAYPMDDVKVLVEKLQNLERQLWEAF